MESGGGPNSENLPKRAVLLAIDYPPYSGASNFNVRGDPSQSPTPNASNAPYLAVALQQAIAASGQRLRDIIGIHHLFRRIIYLQRRNCNALLGHCKSSSHSPLEETTSLKMCSGQFFSKARVPSAVTPRVVPDYPASKLGGLSNTTRTTIVIIVSSASRRARSRCAHLDVRVYRCDVTQDTGRV